jgi:CelD/BcsL family acetyltransferase involved in cellulose biosynthesis
MVKIITTLEELKSISKQWHELATQFNSPLLQYEWFASCAEALLHSDELRIVVTHSNGRINGVAPLVLTGNDGPEQLEILGARVLGEPVAFLYDSEASLQDLTAAILDMRKPLFVKNLRHDSPEITHLRRQHKGKYFVRTGASSPFISFAGTWSDFLANMSSNDRNHLRRKKQSMDQKGKVTFEICNPDRSCVKDTLDDFIRVEAAGWKGQQRTALAFDQPLRCFFDTYAREANSRGYLRFCLLRVDDKLIAGQIAVLYANRFWMLKVGYDEEWAAYSPGVLLTHEAIRHACQEGLEGFEFLGRDEQWIHRWTRQVHRYVTFVGYPFSYSGVGRFAFDASKSIFRKSAKAAGYRQIRTSIGKLASRVFQHIAPRYVAGPEIEDAIRICRQLDVKGWGSTICPWDGPNDTPKAIASSYTKALQAIAAAKLDCYLSIKVPSLKYDFGLLKGLLEVASQHNARVHFDSLAPDTASRSFALLDKAASIYRNLGCTLPSRWRRSATDAETAVALGVAVRVVKGQWADPAQPDIDWRRHYLDLIDILAGRVSMVAVASHDVELAKDSLVKLTQSRTPCELEQLFGLPLRVREVAKPLGVSLRIYVPYGHAYVPYALVEIKKRPVILSWIVRDLLLNDNRLRFSCSEGCENMRLAEWSRRVIDMRGDSMGKVWPAMSALRSTARYWRSGQA